jgi:hypothetical protein
MSGIFGLLGVNDSSREYVNTVGQMAVFTAATEYLTKVNEDMAAFLAVFVEETTENHTERYYLPGGGFLAKRAKLATGPARKAYGYWDVAYPLEDYGEQLAYSDIDVAHMTLQDMQRHLDSIVIADVNQVRWNVLHAMLDDGGGAATTFVDEYKGSLSIQPLANGDAVVYPPVMGSTSEAAEDHYAESGYAANAISDANNPLITVRDELEEHFGQGNIVVFCNNAQSTKLSDLTDFDPIDDQYVQAGANADRIIGMPGVPGRIIGRSNNVWVSEWRWMPANYLFGLDLERPKPLKMRVDPAFTGLGQGLQLVSNDDKYPLQAAHYRHRYGFGVGNRLNGAVLEFGVAGTYTIPTDYD